ncbi:unnamed protein product [Knipowitschia caucasica]|uniref:Uncharacterized protein n=1 Tax=Knipowitschia caucasica TaxID=637954 RepID=A0AAV2JUG8_KNICA
MAAATSSTSTALPLKHTELLRKRIDPRRRQAALSFLSNISLDGRPVQDDADNPPEEESCVEPRTRLSLVSPERCVSVASANTLSLTNQATQALLASSRAAHGTGPTSGGAGAPGAAGAPVSADNGEGDAFLPAAFSSPFSAVPTSARGRLQTYTPGIMPATYSRQSSQSYSLEGGQIELQRSR